MLSVDRLSGDSGCIELDLLERETTLGPGMKLCIRLYLAGLSLSDTVLILGSRVSIAIEPRSSVGSEI